MSPPASWPCRIACLVWLMVTSGALPAQATESGGVSVASESLYLRGLPPRDDRESRPACADCHRRSGLGTVEGAVLVPAVGHGLLAQPGMNSRGARPAYTDALILRAVTEGLDAAGRPLDPLMPRYPLTRQEGDDLLATLRTLGAETPPGVTEDTIRFATILTDDTKEADRDAFLQVLTRFVAVKNGGTRGETRRRHAERTPRDWWHRRHYLAFRKWELVVWDLKGPPDGWRDQLERLARDEPAFAVLSGLSTQTWDPIHRFCNDQRIPCLLPLAEATGAADTDFYTPYFSAGSSLLARLAAAHLGHNTTVPPGMPVIQVYREHGAGARAAAAFRDARVLPEASSVIRDAMIPAGMPPEKVAWQALLPEPSSVVVMLWLDEPDLASLNAVLDLKRDWHRVYASATTPYTAPAMIRPDLSGDVYLVSLTQPPRPGKFWFPREEAWLLKQGIPPSHRLLQAHALLTCTLLGEAMQHIGNHYSRDYLVERIEHMLDGSWPSSLYPRLSLGNDQRFLVKGGFVVRQDLWGKPGAADAPFIIP